MAGFVSAASVEPVEHPGNITVEGGGNNDAAACDADDAIFLNGGDTPETEGTSANGVTVTVTYNEDKSFDFVADGGLVTIAYVKGSNSYFEYNYGAGVASDTNLVSPDAGGSGGAAAVSHLIFCTVVFEQSEEAETDEPSEPVITDEPSEPVITDAPSFEQSVGADTDAPSEPDTAAIGGSNQTGSPADSAWLLVVALGVLLSSIVVLTPARAKNRR
jgi:hypothetical protein